MMEDSIPVRSPFRPLQQSIHNANKDRLRDSPMDFSYDSPSHEKNHTSSSWLNGGGQITSGEKRPREAIDRTEVFSFGGKEGQSTSGAFLFHQPLQPTDEGPDVDMLHEPRQSASTSNDYPPDASETTASQHEETGRPIISSGALTRVSKSRGNAAKARGNGVGISSDSRKPERTSSVSRNRRRNRSKQEDEWEDDEAEKERQVSSRRLGDTTTNIQYVFGGGHIIDQKKVEGRSYLNMIDPEWCLGMAQVLFNATLLLGVLYLFYGVFRTLQRDVADKVREYELEFLAEIEACSHSFHLNKCGTDGAVPALAAACSSWQKCAAKDPAIVGRARVAAETVAEIVNGFVDVVSWKSMIFTLLSLVIVVGATNSTLSFFRLRSRKSNHEAHSVPSHYDPRAIHPNYANPTYHPSHPYSHSHWIPDPPATPSTKRMCR